MIFNKIYKNFQEFWIRYEEKIIHDAVIHKYCPEELVQIGFEARQFEVDELKKAIKRLTKFRGG